MASYLLLSQLVLCSYRCIALAVAAGHQQRKFTVVPPAFVQPSSEAEASCSTPRGTPHANRVSVPLAHRNGPCSPVQSKTELSGAEMLRQDRERTEYIIRRASRSRSKRLQDNGVVSVPTQLGSSYDSQQYVATVGFGTPAVPQTLMLDTGSSLTWVQCKPSNSSQCYPQRLPLFGVAPPVGRLDTCYNFTGYDSVTVPTVSLIFRGGATVHLDASSGVLLHACLALWSSTGDEYTGLIGSVSQRTIEVRYDMPGGKVGFRTGAC